MSNLVIGLGSNMGERRTNICLALKTLENNGLRPVRVSSLYETEPYGYYEQGLFLNCVALFEYSGSPIELMKEVLRIETELGRVRALKWGPRMIDIDILLLGDLVIESALLTVPHYDMHNRSFVLLPLMEILPEARDPKSGLLYSSFLREEMYRSCRLVESPFICHEKPDSTTE
ncbi:MAG TPA: 2-amino-4-hydroxy-6-hydroxymethyldihydropteridine diphosphokinase [Kosmotogaceae bacterium]|nr:MAG: 2-amino-4-hydroxy-6-hydroxymethyldihydropteridine pyrophosphokinase [Thermotogales bacterium 46_20]HAA85776.1 2-amino-4-hydroxy-6-hydroxymethyldihydropteridine diphosphokinase [Kosmotogaceae bacterium]